jgi:hypothetical protein
MATPTLPVRAQCLSMPFALCRHAAPSLSQSSCAPSSSSLSLRAVAPRRRLHFSPQLFTAEFALCHSCSPPHLATAAAPRRRSAPPLLAAFTAPRPARRRSAPPLHWQLLAAYPRRCKGLHPLLATAPCACCIYGCKPLRHPAACSRQARLSPSLSPSPSRPWGQATKSSCISAIIKFNIRYPQLPPRRCASSSLLRPHCPASPTHLAAPPRHQGSPLSPRHPTSPNHLAAAPRRAPTGTVGARTCGGSVAGLRQLAALSPGSCLPPPFYMSVRPFGIDARGQSQQPLACSYGTDARGQSHHPLACSYGTDACQRM